jgi:superoxide oxidase
MTSSIASDRYTSPVIALHWLIFLLIVISYASIELREFFPKGSAPREAMKSLHFMIGLTVLALAVARIAARFLSPTPRILPPPPHWQEIAARLVHLALLVFMIAMPVLGWLILSAEGDPIPFWGLELPPLIAPDKALAEQVEEIHETIGNIGYFLIGAHAAAALFHHYVVGDNTLVRMLPRRSA